MNLKQAAKEMRRNEVYADKSQLQAIKSLNNSVNNQAEFARKNISVAWRQNG